MIQIKRIPNPLEDTGRVNYVQPYRGGFTVRQYIETVNHKPNDWKIIHNGGPCKDLDTVPVDGDEILLLPDIKDPVTVTAAIITAAKIITAILSVVAVVYSVVTAVQMRRRAKGYNSVGVGGGADSFDDNSPTYGWEGIQNTAEIGRAIPVIYGEHRVGGNIVNQFVKNDGDKNYLNVLISLGFGEIESISDIEINENPSSNYSGITTETRLGTLDQSSIDYFNDLNNVRSVDANLTQNNGYVHTTADSDVQAFEVNLILSSGLYEQKEETGAIVSWSVTYTVEYRITGSGDPYTLAGTYSVSAKSRTAIRRTTRIDGLTANQYDIRITRTSADSDFYRTGDLNLTSVNEIRHEELAYPGMALLGVKALATDQLSGAQPRITSLVKGRKVSIPDVQYSGSPIDWEDYYWDPVAEEYKRFSDDATCTWDGSTFVDKWSANPIWCMHDLILSSRYGLGDFVTAENYSIPYLVELSKYCEEKVDDGNGGYEKRFRLDVVIDSQARALDVLNQLSTAFRGYPIYSGGIIKVDIDRPAAVSQLFGMGNIIRGSFSQQWMPIKDAPNILYVQFLDKDKNYKNEVVRVFDEAALAAGEPRRERNIKYYGTRTSYALREGTFQLARMRNVTRSIAFKAATDAIVCTANQLIGVSHDVPQWGFSGRIGTGSTTSSVVLDRQVTIEAAITYKLQVQFADDTIEEVTVTNSPETTNTLTVSPALSQAPAAYDKYAFGQNNKVIKPFKIVSVSRSGKNESDIAAIEYVEAIYDTGMIVIPTTNYSALSSTAPDVENLALTERLVLRKDGTVEGVIDVWFTPPSGAGYYTKTYARARVFLSDDAGASWQFRGIVTESNHFAIEGDLEEGGTYKVAVVSESDRGEQNAIADSPQESITFLGKQAPPSDVTGFDVTQQGDTLQMSWNPVSDPDLARYEIRKGASWNGGQVIAEKVDVTEFSYPVGEIGEQSYMIKAIDTSGNESDTPAIDTLIVTTPPNQNFVNDLDFFSRSLEYVRTNVDVVPTNKYDQTFTRRTMCLQTASTWEDLFASGKGWEEAEADGDLLMGEAVEASGSFEILQVDAFDLETVYEFTVLVDADFANVDGGSVSFEISTSEDGSTWTAFDTLSSAVTYRARYVKFKVLFATSDTNHNVFLYGLKFFINAPTTKRDYGRDLAVPVDGVTITFGPDYEFKPAFQAFITNGVVGDIIVIDLDTTHATVKVQDRTPAFIGTAEISWRSEGI